MKKAYKKATKPFKLTPEIREELLKEKTRLQRMKPQEQITWSDTILELIEEVRRSRTFANEK